jgi:hypothetical protein
MSIRENVLLQLLLIDAACAGAVLALWYFVFSAYNRRKGAAALHWVQSACAGRGRIVEWRWLGSARLHARFRFPSRWFENARVTMKFRPRALPVQWLMSCCRHQKETLTFEADLDRTPDFHLEVFRHRWCARSRGSSPGQDQREWDLFEPGPIILTTRTHWKQDPAPELNVLMAARQQNVLQVRFRPESPQFSATVALDSLSDPQAAANFLTAMRELAAEAKAHPQ